MQLKRALPILKPMKSEQHLIDELKELAPWQFHHTVPATNKDQL